MNVKDIKGTQTGSKNLGNFTELERKDIRETNMIKDVPGAQVNTLKKGMQTKRITDPQNPVYNLPGAKEIGEKAQNSPYGNEGSSMDSKYMEIRKQME